MRLLLAILVVSCITFIAYSQQSLEYGKPEDLKSLTKVFVDTGGDITNRDRIQKEIENAKLGVQLLDSEEGAEIVIDFGGGKKDRLTGSISNGTGSVMTRTYNTGEGRVYVVRDGKQRVVMSYEGSEKKIWDKKPATNFGKRFVRAYKQANGIK